MNLVMLPMWLLSGTFFSWERFPEAVHPFIRALPLTALNDALRAVMTEGRPLSTLGLELGVLARHRRRSRSSWPSGSSAGSDHQVTVLPSSSFASFFGSSAGSVNGSSTSISLFFRTSV